MNHSQKYQWILRSNNEDVLKAIKNNPGSMLSLHREMVRHVARKHQRHMEQTFNRSLTASIMMSEAGDSYNGEGDYYVKRA